MQKVFNVAVDIGRKLPAPAFEVNTNDLKSVKLLITITNGQTLLNLTDTTVRIAIRKPDSHIIFQDCTVKDATGGQVEVILENQAYITPGTHTAEIMCYKGSEVVAVSGTFSYKSTKGIMNDEAVESKSEFTVINQKIEEAKKLLEDAAESGVGVDEQARQDIQEVTAALAEKVSKSYVDTQVKTIPKGEKGEKGDPGTASVAIDDSVINTTQTWSAQKINEKLNSIPPESATFIKTEKSSNFLNYADATKGGYYAWNTGQWTVRSDIATTGFIPCLPKEIFIVGFDSSIQGGNVTFWNDNKEYVSGLDLVAGKTFTIPDNPSIKYFRTSFYAWQIDAVPRKYKINKGTTLLPYEDFREPYYALDEKIVTKTSFAGMPAEVKKAVEKVNNSYLDQVTFLNQFGDVSIQEGRDQKYGTSYWLLRINRETFDGKIILPKLKFTSTGVNDPATTDVKTFNDKNNYVAVMNAGIFNAETHISDGIVILDGVIVQDKVSTTHQNQYTLAITSGGVMRSYPSATPAATILSDGNKHAVVGFVPIIENSQIVADSILNLCPHANQDNPRQIIGQLPNNDYIICSFDGRGTGEMGLTLKECAEILLNYNVKFAYNLDGGGSTQTFVSKKRINRLLESRKVPTVIVFEKQA